MKAFIVLNTKDIRDKLNEHGFTCPNDHSESYSYLVVYLAKNYYIFSSKLLNYIRIECNPSNISKVFLLSSMGLNLEEIKEIIES